MAGLQFLVSLLVVCLGVLQRERERDCQSIKSVCNSVDKTNLILEEISLVLLVGVVYTSPFPPVFLW